MIKRLIDNIFFIKTWIITTMAVVALFVDKTNNWIHWTWITYFSLTISLLVIEYFEHKKQKMSPLTKAQKYLGDWDAWKRSDGDISADYYEPSPEFTIRTNDKDNNLDFTQEWTRGEIGSHYETGNSAYFRDIYFNEILLRQIHIVIFDGGKKTIVAPSWEAIGKGRIYYYLENSIEYAYQKFHSHQYNKDHSKNLRRSKSGIGFDIPIFADSLELQDFIRFCKMEEQVSPETDPEKQNVLFYALIEKYTEFRNQQ